MVVIMLNSGIIKKAIKEAEKSKMYPFKVGAVIFKGNRIISYGYNKKGHAGKIHPRYRNKYDSIHAEQSAIFKVKNWKKLKNSSILVIRLCRNGFLSMAMPCDMCMKLIEHVEIREIYYTNHNSEIIKKIIWGDLNV